MQGLFNSNSHNGHTEMCVGCCVGGVAGDGSLWAGGGEWAYWGTAAGEEQVCAVEGDSVRWLVEWDGQE